MKTKIFIGGKLLKNVKWTVKVDELTDFYRFSVQFLLKRALESCHTDLFKISPGFTVFEQILSGFTVSRPPPKHPLYNEGRNFPIDYSKKDGVAGHLTILWYYRICTEMIKCTRRPFFAKSHQLEKITNCTKFNSTELNFPPIIAYKCMKNKVNFRLLIYVITLSIMVFAFHGAVSNSLHFGVSGPL